VRFETHEAVNMKLRFSRIQRHTIEYQSFNAA